MVGIYRKVDFKLKLTSNKVFAIIAILLAAFALIAENPFSSKQSFITPEQFADSLIARKQNLKIIDLRSAEGFRKYHIPTSSNINLPGLGSVSLSKNDMIVFYSGRDNDSKTAQYEFEKKGFKNVYFLKGGIDGWMNKVIFPVLLQNASETEKKEFEKLERRSMYFGGQPEREGDNTKKVYRREGC